MQVQVKLYRFCSPYINHFLQPDSLIPDPSNPQAWNRYSYALNNPIRFNDPTGHRVACEAGDGNGCTKDKGFSKLESLTYKVTKNYAINLKGKWTVDELTNLNATLEKLTMAVGGIGNLNSTLIHAAQTQDPTAKTVNVERVAGAKWNPAGTPPSAAAWCIAKPSGACSSNTILFADDVFSDNYQFNRSGSDGPSYPRKPFTSNLDIAIQFTMAHEFSHALADANPISRKTYKTVWGGTNESMANELALQVTTGGGLNLVLGHFNMVFGITAALAIVKW